MSGAFKRIGALQDDYGCTQEYLDSWQYCGNCVPLLVNTVSTSLMCTSCTDYCEHCLTFSIQRRTGLWRKAVLRLVYCSWGRCLSRKVGREATQGTGTLPVVLLTSRGEGACSTRHRSLQVVRHECVGYTTRKAAQSCNYIP